MFNIHIKGTLVLIPLCPVNPKPNTSKEKSVMDAVDVVICPVYLYPASLDIVNNWVERIYFAIGNKKYSFKKANRIILKFSNGCSFDVQFMCRNLFLLGSVRKYYLFLEVNKCSNFDYINIILKLININKGYSFGKILENCIAPHIPFVESEKSTTRELKLDKRKLYKLSNVANKLIFQSPIDKICKKKASILSNYLASGESAFKTLMNHESCFLKEKQNEIHPNTR